MCDHQICKEERSLETTFRMGRVREKGPGGRVKAKKGMKGHDFLRQGQDIGRKCLEGSRQTEDQGKPRKHRDRGEEVRDMAEER